jgi:cystathionine beta-lyase/cystathionine gamma-synthase
MTTTFPPAVAEDTITPALDTVALHAGAFPDPTTGAILVPVYQSTTYVQEAVGKHKGYTYSRSGNPTVTALERRLAALEGAAFCSCYSTGLAATTVLALALLDAGERAVVSDVAYGGTIRLFHQVLARFGVETDFVDTADLAALERALARPARLLFIETPANPTLKLTDIAAAARLGHAAGAVVAVDNTILTPVLQRPLELAPTSCCTRRPSSSTATTPPWAARCSPTTRHCTRSSPGTATPPAPSSRRGTPGSPCRASRRSLRIERHTRNAAVVAAWHERHPRVTRILYPASRAFPSTSSLCCNRRAAARSSRSRSKEAPRPASA